MENLYNNVITGKYSPIPNIFSTDIANVIKSMLQVNPKLRPTCLTILNMESVKKRIEKYFGKDYLLDERQTFQGLR
jgi:NIMA (never in mitosis gene a)-related kinase 1/4/5